ncbi:hypothetical protein [Achromobacter kerstersii]|uniref:hypothetical protein n=1 Tax=Achromobacter kerstersii TaxID=1353890 RepID=UPI00320B4620
MDEIKFEDWRLHIFWGAVALAAAIAGFVFGWGWRDRSGAWADVRLLDALTALGTLSAVFAAIWVANRQRTDSAAADTRSGEVAYWIVLPEVLQIRDVHFPILESTLYEVLHQADGELVSEESRLLVSQVVGRMSMEGTKSVIGNLPLIRSGAGAKVAEVYGRFERLKTNLSGIATHDKPIDDAFRLHVKLNRDRILQLTDSLRSPNIWK